MSEKVRGALFNALGDIDGLRVLDAFAGSGALSFEALSRGASHATAIDPDRNAQRAITENIQALNVADSVKLVKATAEAWLSTTDELFDIVICDPPYDAVKPQLLNQLADRCEPVGIVVLSLPPATELALPEGQYERLATKDYGDASLYFYRRSA